MPIALIGWTALLSLLITLVRTASTGRNGGQHAAHHRLAERAGATGGERALPRVHDRFFGGLTWDVMRNQSVPERAERDRQAASVVPRSPTTYGTAWSGGANPPRAHPGSGAGATSTAQTGVGAPGVAAEAVGPGAVDPTGCGGVDAAAVAGLVANGVIGTGEGAEPAVVVVAATTTLSAPTLLRAPTPIALCLPPIDRVWRPRRPRRRASIPVAAPVSRWWHRCRDTCAGARMPVRSALRSWPRRRRGGGTGVVKAAPERFRQAGGARRAQTGDGTITAGCIGVAGGVRVGLRDLLGSWPVYRQLVGPTGWAGGRRPSRRAREAVDPAHRDGRPGGATPCARTAPWAAPSRCS